MYQYIYAEKEYAKKHSIIFGSLKEKPYLCNAFEKQRF